MIFGLSSLSLGAQSDFNSKKTIKICEDVSVNWYVKAEYISHDSIFKFNRSRVEQIKAQLIDCVEDRTVLDLTVCGKTKPLRKGDLAYLLLKELKVMPKGCTEEGYNTYKGMCMYPVGFMDHLEANREKIAAKLWDCVL